MAVSPLTSGMGAKMSQSLIPLSSVALAARSSSCAVTISALVMGGIEPTNKGPVVELRKSLLLVALVNSRREKVPELFFDRCRSLNGLSDSVLRRSSVALPQPVHFNYDVSLDQPQLPANLGVTTVRSFASEEHFQLPEGGFIPAGGELLLQPGQHVSNDIAHSRS